jgi:hypothetical protein
LTPTITEAVLSGQLPGAMDLAKLLKPFPLEWQKREATFFKRA